MFTLSRSLKLLRSCQIRLYFLGTIGAFSASVSFSEYSGILRPHTSPWSCLVGWVVGESYSIHASFFQHVLKPVDVHVVVAKTSRILAAGQMGSLEEVISWHGLLSIVLISLALFVMVTILADFFLRFVRLRTPTILPLRLSSKSNFA
jgi:hypothetical protein